MSYILLKIITNFKYLGFVLMHEALGFLTAFFTLRDDSAVLIKTLFKLKTLKNHSLDVKNIKRQLKTGIKRVFIEIISTSKLKMTALSLKKFAFLLLTKSHKKDDNIWTISFKYKHLQKRL